MDFSHFNEQGRAKMVDVTEKEETFREAIAEGKVLVSKDHGGKENVRDHPDVSSADAVVSRYPF